MFESPLDWLRQYGDRELVSLERFSPQTLAYLGDAVFELYIRTTCLLPPRRLADHHRQVVAKVKAESQAETLQQLLPYLTEIELDWVRRGRNGATGCPRRLPLAVYQQATGLETLLGYLYLQNPERLQEVLQLLSKLDSY